MKSLSRNFAIALFVAFVIGSIYGCAEKPITFAGPGVQIWSLNITYTDPVKFKMNNQKMMLTPSGTEKDVFSVVAEISADISPPVGPWGLFFVDGKWVGEVRNGNFVGKMNTVATVSLEGGSGICRGTVKGTFSGSRAAGTLNDICPVFNRSGKWTAEKIS